MCRLAPLLLVMSVIATAQTLADEAVKLNLRHRSETAPGSERFHAVESPAEWQTRETAIVVCDMWDKHWCRGAMARVAEMAPRMNEVLKAARSRGVLVIHCPSECMEFYEDTPQRRRAQSAPAVASARPIEGWRPLDANLEKPLPIDDSDGGCDCQPQCEHGAPWKRQIAAIEIGPDDAVTDSAEAIYLMRARGVKNVIVMGVHTNMCVLGRPFAIRQLIEQGQNVALMRDMTDTMYNSRREPHVSHFSGTDLVVAHIERFWCPTLTSGAFTCLGEFRFAADKRPHVAILMAEDEYDTARTLSEFSAERLQKDFRLSLIYGSEKDRDDLPGIEEVRTAGTIVVSVRRRTLPAYQLAILREHIAKGKAMVGIRTASHAFTPQSGASVAEGKDAWPAFDRDVLGGNYTGHYGNKGEQSDRTMIHVLKHARQHPVLAGVPEGEFVSRSWLYKVSPLAATATPLMMGRVEGHNEAEPVAWTNMAGKSRVFYTSLGHADDFKLPAFTQLLENGIRWAAQTSVEEP